MKRPVPPSPKNDKTNQNWVRNINYYRKTCASVPAKTVFWKRYIYANFWVSLQELFRSVSFIMYYTATYWCLIVTAPFWDVADISSDYF